MSSNNKSYPAFSFAFQPIYNAVTERVVSFETLLRGPSGESPGSIFSQIEQGDLYAFDEHIRTEAISLASMLGIGCHLNLNFMPGNLFASKTAVSSVIDAANIYGLPINTIILEVTESEIIEDIKSFAEKINRYRSQGLSIAIDDFGAGYAGLNLLADFQPDFVKIDLSIIRDIHKSGPRQAITRGILVTCRDLGIEVIAEGVETKEEYDWCLEEEVKLFQGYYIAKPGFEHFPFLFSD
jgi:EAL domain-containing protein (putative c-di-GMP-specific phosphodiesterase class I)